MRILNTPISSVVIHISSDDTNTRSDSQFSEIILDTPVLCPSGYIMLLSLSSAEIPFSFYVCNQYNNILEITENGASRTITIPFGNYTPSSLRTKLLGLLGFTYGIKYNADSMKFEFTTTRANVTFHMDESTCNELLGFSNDDFTFDDGFLESTRVINFNYTNSIYLTTDFTDVGSIDSRSKRYTNILAKIPINTMAGGMIYFYGNQTTHKVIYHSSSIQKVQLQLTDDKLRPINFNGVRFEVSLLVDFQEKEEMLEGTPQLGFDKPLLS